MEQLIEPENAPRTTKPYARRILRRVLLVATCLIVLALLGVYGSTVYFMNKAFTHRVERCKTIPEDLGLTAETVSLTSSDGIPLKGWWIPADPSPRRGCRASWNGRTARSLSPSPCEVPP